MTLLIFSGIALSFSYTYIEKGIPSVEYHNGRAEIRLVGAAKANIGEPDLPVKFLNLALPEGLKATDIHFTLETEHLASNTSVGEVVSTDFENPWALISPPSNVSLPAIELIGTGYLYGIPIAQLKIRPAIYSPKTGTIQWLNSAQIKLTLESDELVFPERTALAPISSAIRERALLTTVANPSALPKPAPAALMTYLSAPSRHFPPAPGDDPVDGVVIAADEFIDHLDYLRDEIAFGVILDIIPVSQILDFYSTGVDRSEKIRNFIKDAYIHWGITGVFLVGSTDNVPVRMRYGLDPVRSFTEVPTDLYYTVMDGNWNYDGDMHFGEDDEDDYLPELFIGRIQPVDTSEVLAYMDKIDIHRWKLDEDFISRWLFACASLSGTDRLGPVLCDSIIEAGPIPTGIETVRLYSMADSSASDIEFTKDNFITQLDSGCYFICHIDHGYQYIIHTSKTTTGDGISIPEFLGLDNGPYFPILYTYSCEVNAIDLESVGAAAVRSKEGGCVALVAHSRSAWTTQINLAYIFWNDNLLSNGKSIKIGEVVRGEISSFSDDQTMRYYKAITTLFGYPFLDLNVGVPKRIDLIVTPTFLTSSDTIIEVQVNEAGGGSPIDSVMIVAYTESGRYAITRTDPAGLANIHFSPSGEDEVYIVASGGGVFAKADTLNVTASIDPFVIVEDALFRAIGGDSDIYPEPGDTFTCDLLIKNTGATRSDSIIITSECEGILDSSIISHGLDAGDTCTITGAFSFMVEQNLRGYYNLRPITKIISSGYTSIDTLSLRLHGPILDLFSIYYYDMDNSLPDPGEPATIYLGLLNLGYGDFHDCNAEISLIGATTPTPCIFLGDIPASDSVTLSIPIIPDSYDVRATVELQFSNATPETLLISPRKPYPPDSLNMTPSVTSIQLNWHPPTDTSVVGYHVYRADSICSSWLRLTTYPITHTLFVDEGLPERTTYFYRVTSIDDWGNESEPSDSLKGWTTLPFLSPWPRSIGESVQIYATPILWDIDGDGAQEIFVTGKNYNAIWAFHGNGSDVVDSTVEPDPLAVIAWDDSIPAEQAVWGSPAIADVNGDGSYEILINDRHTSFKLHLISANDGTELPGWPTNINMTSMATPVLENLDKTGNMEAINPTFDGLEVYNASGTPYLPSSDGHFNLFEPFYPGTFFGSPAVGDIDGDGRLDVVYGGLVDTMNNGTVWAFDDSGNVKPGWPVRLPHTDFSIGSVTLANFDSDPWTLEVLIPARFNGLHLLSHNGSIMPGWPKGEYFFPNFVSHTAAVDIDGDGICEVIAAGSYKLAIFNADGTPMPGWPVTLGNTALYAGNPTVGDIDGDSVWEILYTLKNRIFAFELDAEPIPGFPLVLPDDAFGAPSLAMLTAMAIWKSW